MKSRRQIKLLLTIATFIVVVIALFLFSEDAEASDSTSNSGLCGENIKWSYNSSTRELTISGTGDMDNFKTYAFGLEYKSTAPWGRKSIDNVVFEGNIQSIGHYAFYNTTIKTIELPNSLKEIGLNAFTSCDNLKELYIPGSVEKLIEKFGGCSSLTHVVVGEGTKRIDDFRDCKKLTSVELPNSIESISGFNNCNKLIIDYNSYPNLKTIEIENLPSMPKITIPNTCSKVFLSKLYNSSYSLEEITLGKNVSSFDTSTTSTGSLKDIYVDNDNQFYSSVDGILYNKNQSELIYYPDKKTSETYNVPDSVSKMCSIANSHIKLLTIGKNVEEAGEFKGKLDILNVPHGLQQFSDLPSKVASIPTDYQLDSYIDGGIVLKYYSKYIDQVIVTPHSDGKYKVHVEFNTDIQYKSIRIGTEYNLQDVQQSTNNDFILSSDASWYKSVFLSLETGEDESAPVWEEPDPPLITGEGIIALLGIIAIVVLASIGGTVLIIIIKH